MLPPIESVQKIDIDHNVGVNCTEQIVDVPESLVSRRQNALRDSHGIITIPASCLGLGSVNDGVLLIPADDEYESKGLMNNASLLLKRKSTNVAAADSNSHTCMVVVSGENNNQPRRSSFLTIIKSPAAENVKSKHESTASLSSMVDYFVGHSAH